MPSRVTFEQFTDAVAEVFGPLADQLGPSEVRAEHVVFLRPERELMVHRSTRSGRTSTVVIVPEDGLRWSARVESLLVATGLGVRQDVRPIATAPKFLVPVLLTHRAAVEKLLPVIDGPDGVALVRSCNGT